MMGTVEHLYGSEKMELRVLRYFLTVAREGSVTGAANFLHVTQPTLSKQIKELEEQLGTKLLVRHSHNVTLTAEGMRLRKRAEEILDMVEKTKSEFNTVEDDIGGEIHIGGGETRTMRLVAEVVDAMRSDYPRIRYEFHSGNAVDVMERLDKGLLDFGILLQPADLSRYNHIALPEKDVWGLVMRKDSPLAARKTIRRKDLLNIPLIGSRVTAHQGRRKSAFADWFGKDFDRLNIIVRYNLIYNATLLVEQGIGYALAIDGLANVTDTGKLCFRPLEPRLESGLDLVWKKYQIFSPAAQIFLDSIQEKLECIGD